MRIARGEFVLSSDVADMQPAQIHAYLTRSYWAEGISLELVQRCVTNSLCYGVFHNRVQISFARVVSDQSTFAYLADVYVLEEYRGKGLASWMIETITADARLQGLRRFMLATRDAHSLYAKFGFAAPARPQALMEIARPGLYKQAPS